MLKSMRSADAFSRSSLSKELRSLIEKSKMKLLQPGNDVLSEDVLQKAITNLKALGVNSKLTLYEMSLRYPLSALSEQIGISSQPTSLIINEIINTIDEAAKKRIQAAMNKKGSTGHIDWKDPDIKKFYEARGIKEKLPLSRYDFDKIKFSTYLTYLIPKGPKKAVDLRPFLGDVRNQNPRGTCAVHGAIAVAEALEYLKDRRQGTADLSEEFVWWYRGAGQRYSSGGYDCGAAVDDIGEVGVCEEFILPYINQQINDNHTIVPIADIAMDRAQFYQTGDSVTLPDGDIDAIKSVLETGRCVCFGSNLDGWIAETGEITMPPVGTTLGASHCTTIVGYIDRDDLPDEYEGGYFIIRNSWGGAGSPDNILGPEYGGHLLMPYSWYKMYTGWHHTITDRNDDGHRNLWLTEFYANPQLKGAPLHVINIRYEILFFNFIEHVAVPQMTENIDYDWHSGSPLQFRIPLLSRTVEVLPVDNFSARFTKIIRLREGWIRFRLRGDDGMRLYVDDRLVINAWKNQAPTEYEEEYHVTGGDHIIRIEYYEATGNAEVHFTIEPINWHYELFDNYGFTGDPSAAFDDTITELEWRHQPPVVASEELTYGQFALRGSANIFFKRGDYRLHNFSTGNLRFYIDENPFLANDQFSVSEGAHAIRIEFENFSAVPEDGSHTYYKALCKFGWSDVGWNAKFYKNNKSEEYFDNPSSYVNEPDSNYIFFNTNGLSGDIIHQHNYPEESSMNNNLNFNNWDSFKTGVTAWPAALDQMKFFGVWINRRIVILTDGIYNFELNANEGFRLIVDGKEIVQNREFIGSSPYNKDVYLQTGVHDLSIEYNVTLWGGHLNFNINKVQWHIECFLNTNLEGTVVGSIDTSFEEIINQVEDFVHQHNNYSARISRTLWMPLGKYNFQVKADDGVRLRINNKLLIDAWVNQGATTYSGNYEHIGGDVKIEIEYYQQDGDALIEFNVHPVEFYAEYYNTNNLNRNPGGIERPRKTPITYRYESDINFDWGQGSSLPRVGSKKFSARWRGKVNLPVGRWSIEAVADDGIRVYIDGRLIIDSWVQGLTNYSQLIDLNGREHDVMVEYFQETGAGVCKLKYVRII